ncbi:MAG: ribosome maturation factor RimP [Clostridia bacterium]|nr:ribosome maturation factor RimP [Clostridia bacterium]
MAGKVETICNEKIRPVIEELGYELVDIEYSKKVDGMNLDFIIDSPNGILIEDCVKVHRAIDELLDEVNPTDDAPYILNVSSPGIDRPIKTERDFLRNKNKLVEVKCFAPINGKKLYVGNLIDFTEKTVTLKENDVEVELDRAKVAIITPVIEF